MNSNMSNRPRLDCQSMLLYPRREETHQVTNTIYCRMSDIGEYLVDSLDTNLKDTLYRPAIV